MLAYNCFIRNRTRIFHELWFHLLLMNGYNQRDENELLWGYRGGTNILCRNKLKHKVEEANKHARLLGSVLAVHLEHCAENKNTKK